MKKVLSFVLSVAMIICLMPAMAFADDAPATTGATATGLSQFSDTDSITNEMKEAVAVLVGLGIIDGMGDGTFQPQGNLTRAQASKLVATLAKSGDKSDIPAPAVDPFTDVATSHWAAGAIKYGVDNGYINGMGDGTFHPDDQVTTAQLATMICKLLGYSVEDINYHWPENAMATANNAGLLYSIYKGSTENLNRQEAAQMLFNGLIADTVMKSSISGSESHEVDGGTAYVPVYNKNELDCGFHRWMFNAKDGNGNLLFNVQQLIEKYFPKATFVKWWDAFGRESTVWKNGRVDMTDEVTKAPAFTYTSRQVAEFTQKWNTGVGNSQIAKDLEGYEANGAEVVVNGVSTTYNTYGLLSSGDIGPVTLSDFITEDFSEYLANTISAYTGNGVQVEVYTDEKDTQVERVIVIDYDIDMVARVSSKTGDITLDKNGIIDKKADYYSSISTVAKGDFVLVAKNSREIVDVVIPKEINNVAVTKITSETKDGREDAVATIGGQDYSLGHDSYLIGTVYENPYGELSYGLPINGKDNGTVYLDQFDNVVAYRSVKLPDWALLTSVYKVDKYNELGEAYTEWYGQLVKEDGTTDTVLLLYINDSTEPGYNTPAASSTREILNSFMTKNRAVGDKNWFDHKGKLVHYIESAAGYRLYDSINPTYISYTPNSIGVEVPKTTIDSSFNNGTKAIDGYYFADTVNVISVNGKKASTLQVVKSDKINQTYISGSYKYVAKRIDGTAYLVTTIYLVDTEHYNDTNRVIKVVDVLSRSADGLEVSYYTDDSDQEQGPLFISNETIDMNSSSGFFFTERIEDYMFLEDNNEALNYENYTVDKANGDYGVKTASMVLGGKEYKFASDATVVDLSGEERLGDNNDIAGLVDLISSIGRADPTSSTIIDPLHITFAYVADDKDPDPDKTTKIVKQVYIEK